MSCIIASYFVRAIKLPLSSKSSIYTSKVTSITFLSNSLITQMHYECHTIVILLPCASAGAM